MQYDLCVVEGLSRTGLSLAVVFARRGLRVLIHDVDEGAADAVRGGRTPFREENGDAFLSDALRDGNLHLTSDIAKVSEASFLVVMSGTPVDEYLNPRLEVLMDLLRQMVPHMRDGQTVLLRGTVFPGTTSLVKDYFDKSGKKVAVAYCPERISEGRAMQELCELPQIVAAFTPHDTKAIRDLFARLGAESVELAPMEAELGKLFNNVWRYWQFAVSNQFYTLANNYNLDFYRIFDAITYKYPRIGGMAKPGFAAGPCLFTDTLQLAAFNKNMFGLGYTSIITNEGLPNHIVERLKRRMPLKDKVVGILGMAYKADSDDDRGSLAYKLRRILRWEAAEVLCTDCHVQRPDFLPLEEVVRRSSILVLATPHREYKNLQLDDKIVVDVWNFFGKGGLV